MNLYKCCLRILVLFKKCENTRVKQFRAVKGMDGERFYFSNIGKNHCILYKIYIYIFFLNFINFLNNLFPTVKLTQLIRQISALTPLSIMENLPCITLDPFMVRKGGTGGYLYRRTSTRRTQFICKARGACLRSSHKPSIHAPRDSSIAPPSRLTHLHFY